jgi:transposase
LKVRIVMPTTGRIEMKTRRFAAAEDLIGKMKQSEVARKYGVSRTTVSRWKADLGPNLEEPNLKALEIRTGGGRISRFAAKGISAKDIQDLWDSGSRSFGFGTDKWTCERFADAIFTKFGIRFDSDHAGRLINKYELRPRRLRGVITLVPTMVTLVDFPVASLPEAQA